MTGLILKVLAPKLAIFVLLQHCNLSSLYFPCIMLYKNEDILFSGNFAILNGFPWNKGWGDDQSPQAPHQYNRTGIADLYPSQRLLVYVLKNVGPSQTKSEMLLGP